MLFGALCLYCRVYMAVKHFHKDLKKGQAGELELLGHFSALKKADGRTGDALLGDAKIELKSDFYEHKPGGNFFIERFSSVDLASPGGPWQAKAHGCEYYVYYFLNSKVGYVFAVDSLLTQMEAIEAQLKPCYVKNIKWLTMGYKVPHTMLKPEFQFSTKSGLKLLVGNEELFKKFTGG